MIIIINKEKSPLFLHHLQILATVAWNHPPHLPRQSITNGGATVENTIKGSGSLSGWAAYSVTLPCGLDNSKQL